MKNSNTHQYVGRIVGTVLGLITLGPFGLFMGYFLGSLFDNFAQYFRPKKGADSNFNTIEHRFYEATFLLLGHISKSNGRVTQAEIDVATSVMNRLNLTIEQKRYAMKLFYNGKNGDFDFYQTIENIKPFRAFPYCRSFLQFLSEMVNVDGTRQANKAKIFTHICSLLGYNTHQGNQKNKQHSGKREKAHSTIDTAYKTLGVTPKASVKEIRKVYRKLASRYHPDKLTSQGASAAEINKAGEKMSDINTAYEAIMEIKGK
jgi:DnaJ like chaperone protein